MKIKLAALAALCLTVCLICPAQAVSSPPASQDIQVVGTCLTVKDYYEIVLGDPDADHVTLPGDIQLRGASSSASDSGLRIIIIPVTVEDEPDAFAWASVPAAKLGSDPVIYYLMAYRGSTPAVPAGDVTISMTVRSGYEKAALHYMDGDAATARLTASTSEGTVSFAMEKDGFYLFTKTAHQPSRPARPGGPDTPADPAADTPRTGDTFRPAVWLGALTVSAGMTAGLLRRKRS